MTEQKLNIVCCCWEMSTRFYVFQILQIIHTVEECPDTLAFATEPVLASLANILAFYVSQSSSSFPHRPGSICSFHVPIWLIMNMNLKDVTLPTPTTGASQANQPQLPQRPAHATEYNFLDIELKYGILQVKTLPLDLNKVST